MAYRWVDGKETTGDQPCGSLHYTFNYTHYHHHTPPPPTQHTPPQTNTAYNTNAQLSDVMLIALE